MPKELLDLIIILLSYIPLLLILIAFIGYFSGSETGYVSLNSIKLKSMEKDDKKASLVSLMSSKIETLLATTLVGTNVFLIATSSIFSNMIIKMFPNYSQNIRSLIVSIVLTPVIIIFSEVTPKMLFRTKPEKLTVKTAYIMRAAWYIFIPIVKFVQFFTKAIMFILGVKKSGSSPFVTKEEFKLIFELGKMKGVIHDHEEKMITSIIGFGKKIAREVMTPRTDVIFFDINTSVLEAIDLAKQSGFSRIPVYEDDIDNIQGFIYTIDFILNEDKLSDKKLSDFLRKPLFIPEYKNIDDLLNEMQKEKINIAIVIDEYGGVSGIITSEDILEEIVGEIHDETDADNIYCTKISENNYIIDAKMNVKNFNELFDLNIELSENYDTIGGFIYNHLQRIPESDENIVFDNIKFKVVKVTKNKIVKLSIDITNKRKKC